MIVPSIKLPTIVSQDLIELKNYTGSYFVSHAAFLKQKIADTLANPGPGVAITLFE